MKELNLLHIVLIYLAVIRSNLFACQSKNVVTFFTYGEQVLCDSSDISYVFEGDLPDMDYYGEQSFRMQYKDTIGEPFPWLYIDAGRLKLVAEENGYAADVVAEGEHYDYLARITKQ